MNKDNFPQTLKHLREEHNLSQNVLADELSQSHRIFENVTQSMISLWEKGKTSPSFIRKVGIAGYFRKPYRFSGSEVSILKRAQQHKTQFVKQYTFHDFSITDERVVDFSKLTDYQLDWIATSHAHTFNHHWTLQQTIAILEMPSPKVQMFFHHGALVAALVYEIQDKQVKIASSSAINGSIWQYLVRNITTLFKDYEVYIPVNEASLKMMLEDLYIDPMFNHRDMSIYCAPTMQIFGNVYFTQMIKHLDFDFRLLRYELNKNQ